MPDGGSDSIIAGRRMRMKRGGCHLAGTRLLLLRGRALEGLAQNRQHVGIDDLRQNDIAGVIELRALSSVEHGL